MTCYVPFCDSALPTKKGAKREPGVSFHQFPSDEELRKKWIIAIGRKDPKTGSYWDPHSSAVVCSLHFSPKQFRGASKKCVLKQGSIPFIFPDYYLPQRGGLINQDELSSIKLIPFPSNVNSEGTSEQRKSGSNQSSTVSQTSNTNNTKKKAKRTFSEMNSSQAGDDQTVNKQHNSNAPKFKFRIVLANKSQKLVLTQPQCNENLTSPSNVDLVANVSSPDICDEISGMPSLETNLKSSSNGISNTNTSAACTKNPFQNTIEKLLKINNSLSIRLNTEKKKSKMLVDENFKLQEENQNLKLKNRIMEQRLELFNFEELKKGITNSNGKALFLFDQLCSLTQEECTWSQSTINFVNYLEENFPACCNFLRKADIITLPAPKSVSNHDTCREKK